jgi:type VI secretion system protein ImpJ
MAVLPSTPTSCRRRSPQVRVHWYAQLLQEVITGLDQIAEAHAKMVLGGPGRSVEDLLMLNLANAARPRLAHMLAQDIFHPAELYLELAGLAGSMATYGSNSRRLAELPVYDHMAPGPAYSALADTLRSLILSLRYVEPKSRALPVMRHSTNVWKVRIDNPKLLVASRIVIRVGSELSEDALRKIFVNQATVGGRQRIRRPVEVAPAGHTAEAAAFAAA